MLSIDFFSVSRLHNFKLFRCSFSGIQFKMTSNRPANLIGSTYLWSDKSFLQVGVSTSKFWVVRNTFVCKWKLDSVHAKLKTMKLESSHRQFRSISNVFELCSSLFNWNEKYPTTFSNNFNPIKIVCVFVMVILPKFLMAQLIDDGHREDAPHFEIQST